MTHRARDTKRGRVRCDTKVFQTHFSESIVTTAAIVSQLDADSAPAPAGAHADSKKTGVPMRHRRKKAPEVQELTENQRFILNQLPPHFGKI